MSPRPITIVGGGLAGLALGLALRAAGVPVTVWEAGIYPRHRVCGEFIRGRGLGVLRELGLLDALRTEGAGEARTVRFHTRRARSPELRLAVPALVISRHQLDARLAAEFRRRGGDLREGTAWREDTAAPGVVRAAGRRPAAVADDGNRWFGLKAHFRGAAPAADLEMHFAPGGYAGMCRLADGTVNVCGLFRRRPGAPAAAPGPETLRGPPGSRWHERLAAAELVAGSLCAIAGLSLRPRRAAATGDCAIGDALTMIPPVTGNGMSMAFESAALAAEPLAAYSRGDTDWAAARAAVAARCDARFARRLAWAATVQRLLFLPGGAELLVRGAGRLTPVWRALERRTA